MTKLPTADLESVRCSALPLGMICAGSLRTPEIQIDPVNEAADEGTAVHHGLARLIAGLDPDAALEAAVEKFPSVDVEGLRPLFWSGVRMWKQIRDWMPMAKPELFIPAGYLTGHIDIFSKLEGATKAVITDWKSGRKDYSCRDQLFGYCWLVCNTIPEVQEVTAHAAWLRTGELESYTVSRGRADEWYAELLAKVIAWDGVYRPGGHCLHCPRNHDCPAQTALVRRDVAMFSDGASVDLQTMPGPDFVSLHRKLKGLVARAEDALSAMRAEVERRGGDVDAGDGSHLYFVEENGQRKVDALRAWPVLQAALTDEELSPAIKISLATVEKIVAAKAGKGKGAKAKRALAEGLEKAAAVTQPKITKLIDERKK